MKDIERPEVHVLNSVLKGAVLSLGLQSISTLLLLGAQHSGRGDDVARVGLASFVITSLAGFIYVARRAKLAQAFAIGIVYFPTMFGLMFLEAIYLDARIYGNSF
jgi:hypothetical protein